MEAGDRGTAWPHLRWERRGPLALVTLDRAEKRNAIGDELLDGLHRFFSAPPSWARVVVLHGAGEHFSAGLDLGEHAGRTPLEVMAHSRRWHEVFRAIEFGRCPVVAALHGAVIGGGLELAVCAHVRVADESTFYQLPEGRRGIFVGGGASVRVARIMGADRMREMMLTGRRYDAAEGQALGLSHYLVPQGRALERALALAQEVAANAPASNLMMIQALGRIAEMPADDGLFTEALATALTQSAEEAREGMRAFLERRRARFEEADG